MQMQNNLFYNFDDLKTKSDNMDLHQVKLFVHGLKLIFSESIGSFSHQAKNYFCVSPFSSTNYQNDPALLEPFFGDFIHQTKNSYVKMPWLRSKKRP